MSQEVMTRIREVMVTKSTAKLLWIYNQKDYNEWSHDAFTVIYQILVARGVEVDPIVAPINGEKQKNIIFEYEAEKPSSKGTPLIAIGLVVLVITFVGYNWADTYLKSNPLNGLSSLIGSPDSSFSAAVQIMEWSKVSAVVGFLLVIGGMIINAVSKSDPSVETQSNSSKDEQGIPSNPPATEFANNTVAKPTAANPTDFATHLRLLSELKNDGILTEEEFQQKKKELLDRF